MHKRFIALALLIIISFSFSGCENLVNGFLNAIVPTQEEYKPENNNMKNQLKIDKTQLDEDVVLSEYYSSIALNNAFETLETESQQLLYLEIVQYTDVFNEEKNEEGFYTSPMFSVYSCSLTDREVAMVYEAVIEDNPQIFWLSDWYSYAIAEDYVNFQLYYTMSENEHINRKKQLNAVINDLLSNLDKNMSDFELELYFHNYIIRNCVYDKDAVENDNRDSFSVYGTLVLQKAVCQGYTEAFQLLLSYVGINSYRIIGKSQGSDHIWNVVNIDGSDYYVDVTWDDTKDYCMYDYFNITTDQLKIDHTIAPIYKDCADEEIMGENSLNYNLLSAECTESKYNYYIYKGSNLTDLENNNITTDLAEIANKGEKFFHIYVNPDYLDINYVYDELFSSDNYGFAQYIEEVNSQVDSNRLKTNTYVAKKDNLNTITVELIYE